MNKKTNKIILKCVSKSYYKQTGSFEVLHSINMVFNQGNTAIITGESGCGKSTLLHILAGLESPTSGSVWFEDINLTRLTEPERTTWRKHCLGLVFQFPYLIREFSVLENVMLPGLIAGKESEEIEHYAVYLLAQVGLRNKALSRPCVLSGGEQQRVALARALFNKPAFLLADEPTAHLDRVRANEISTLLLDIQEQYTMGLIIVSHDECLLSISSDRFLLSNGILIASDAYQEGLCR